MILNRVVENALRPFSHERNELILRWRLWKMRWLPYRTAEYLGYDEKKDEFIMGPWKWHRPTRFLKRGGDASQ